MGVLRIILISGMLIINTVYSSENLIKTGKQLARSCTWCHDTKRELLAPSFRDIALRYKELPEGEAKEILFNSIKDGSKGKWEKWEKKGVYMPPQKPYFSDEQIKQIVEWILSLD
ncbi:c-type cytochrome [Persephonella sp.]